MSWDSDYYATQNTNHGGRPGISLQCRHLHRLVDLSSNNDYSSGHDNYSQDYHNLECHLSGLCLTSGHHYGVGYDHVEYSSTGEYSTNSTEYRGFEYYHYGVDIAQLPQPYYSDVGSSNQSSQPARSNQQIYYYSYENYILDFYTY